MSEEQTLRERIFAIDDLTSEIVDVPEWGMKLEVRSMTGKERASMHERYTDPDSGDLKMDEVYPAIIVNSVFDPETGEKVFQPEDGARLNTRNSSALERLAKVALRLSGMTEESRKDLGKGSSGPSEGSTST